MPRSFRANSRASRSDGNHNFYCSGTIMRGRYGSLSTRLLNYYKNIHRRKKSLFILRHANPIIQYAKHNENTPTKRVAIVITATVSSIAVCAIFFVDAEFSRQTDCSEKRKGFICKSVYEFRPDFTLIDRAILSMHHAQKRMPFCRFSFT